MEVHVYVKADDNDADYVYRLEKVSTCEELDLINRVAKAVHDDPKHRWFTNERWDICGEDDTYIIYKDKLTKEDIDLFNESYIPSSDYGIHTIHEIKLLNIESTEKLL